MLIYFLLLAAIVLLVFALVWLQQDYDHTSNLFGKNKSDLSMLRDDYVNFRESTASLSVKMKKMEDDFKIFEQSASKVLRYLEKEVEILNVRQRSLEKKIIGSERTVNVHFYDKKVAAIAKEQVEEIRKKGLGKHALIGDN